MVSFQVELSDRVESYVGIDSHFPCGEQKPAIACETTYRLDHRPHGRRYIPKCANCIHELVDREGNQYLLFTMITSAGELIVGRARRPKKDHIDYRHELMDW